MNTDEKKTVVEDVLGFRLVWLAQDHRADVKAYKVESIDGDGKPRFWRTGSSHNGDPVPDYEDAETYLEGYVKWDGCSEIDQGRPHWCGPDGYKKHMDLLKHIYIRAFELMERTPDDPWDAPKPDKTLSVSLDPKFDSALLGTTVHPEHPPRAVYSLDRLSYVLKGDKEAVQRIALDAIARHGDEAPLFVAAARLPKKEKSRIIVPGRFGGN